MKVVRANVHSTEPGSPDNFTGSVWNESLALGESSSQLHVGRVTFAPGARTHWHSHPQGQILLAISGIGHVQSDGEPVRELFQAIAYLLHQKSVTGMVLQGIKYSYISQCKSRGRKAHKLSGSSPLRMTSICKRLAMNRSTNGAGSRPQKAFLESRYSAARRPLERHES